MKISTKTSHSEIVFEIEVDDLNSFESLNALADVYLDLSYRIDENLDKHNIEVEFSTLTYSIDVFTPDGRVEEEEVFSKFVGNPILESKAANFISNVNIWSRANEAHIWQDDENPLAECTAYVLCLQDLKYIPLYIELLVQNDLDHEVYQNEHIEALIEKHGLCKSLLTLLAHRVGGACGQWGMDQVGEYKPQLLEYFNEHPEQRSLFLKTGFKSILDQHMGHQLWFEPIRFLAGFIQNEQERDDWLKDQQEYAEVYFGDGIDFD
ncbi:hypothetical protein [Litoribacillus peritrichatus]|uniref:Uncharacterized protein n=1 Tax=Litoribacillus peritrichatus TaxID=718191 RepID=A0ABP7NA24_9GAMM